jgi:hypothetical protein
MKFGINEFIETFSTLLFAQVITYNNINQIANNSQNFNILTKFYDVNEILSICNLKK